MSASTGEGVTWRLGHRPALDGLRGLAALTVVAAHSHLPIGGGVAVNVFFALSGFLITSLLLDETDRRGSISLRRFYARRARRLLPAMYALVGVVVLVQVVLGLGAWWGQPGVYAAAGVYVSNFVSAAGVSSALGHTWSLAIEEQFYLTWPLLVLLLGRSRRALLWVAVTLAAMSTLWLGVLASAGASEWRLGFGTDTRIAPMLAGCALAVWMRCRAEGRARPQLAGGLLVGLAGLSFIDQVWITPASAVLAAALLWATCQGPAVRWLSHPVLRWLGGRSYSLYLWHYPIALLSDHLAPGLAAPERFALVATLGLAAAELSWRYVEQPFLGPARRRRATALPGTPLLASTPTGPRC